MFVDFITALTDVASFANTSIELAGAFANTSIELAGAFANTSIEIDKLIVRA